MIAVGAVLLGGVILVTALWAYVLLRAHADWNPWLRTLVLVGGLGLAFSVGFAPGVRGRVAVVLRAPRCARSRRSRGVHPLDGVAPHGGAIPLAGPANAAGGPGGSVAGVPPRLPRRRARAGDSAE